MSSIWDNFLVHRVDVFRFAPGQDADGGAAATYPDGTPYAAAEPCYVEIESGTRDYGDQVAVRQLYIRTVFFGRNPGFATNDLILFVDRRGTTHSLFVDGDTDMLDGPYTGLCEVAVTERLVSAMAAVVIPDFLLADDSSDPTLLANDFGDPLTP